MCSATLSRHLVRFAVSAAFLILLSAPPAARAGTITTYNNRPAFNAAVAGPLTVEDFTPTSHFPISTGILNSATNLPGIGIFPGTIKPGVTYSTPIGSSFFFNIDAGGGYSGGFLDGFYGGDPNRVLTIDFDNPVTALAFDTNNIMGTNFNIQIQFTSGPNYNANFPVTGSGSNLQFFGFQSNLRDIRRVIIDGNGNPTFAFALDNFTFDPVGAAVVPEPASLTLFGLGAMALAGYGWRRRRPA